MKFDDYISEYYKYNMQYKDTLQAGCLSLLSNY